MNIPAAFPFTMLSETTPIKIEPSSNTDYMERVEELRFKLDLGHLEFKEPLPVSVEAEEAIAKSYYRVHIDPRFRAIIMFPVQPGSGNIQFAIKTAQSIQDNFKHVEIYLVAWNFEESEEKTSLEKVKFLMPANLNATLRTIDALEEELRKPAKSDTDNPTFIFDVAIPNNDHRFDTGCKGPVHYYHVDKYNGGSTRKGFICQDIISGTHRTFSAGIGFHTPSKVPTVGFHIDAQLEKLSAKECPLDERLGLIKGLEDKNLLDTLLEGRSIKTYCRTNKLYFGYNSGGHQKYLLRFILAILHYESHQTKNIDFCIVCPEADQETLFKDRLIEVFNKLEIKSFRGIVSILVADENQTHTVQCNPHASPLRSVRLLFLNRLKPHDMLTMMQASEPPMLVTGDQSWAEQAALKRKILFYQIHKWKIHFLNQIWGIAAKLSGEESSIFNFFWLMSYGRELHGSSSTFQELKIIKELSELLLKPDLYAQFKQLNETLCKYYNINTWLIGEIKRRLLRKDNPDLDDLENALNSPSQNHFEERLRMLVEAIAAINKRNLSTPLPMLNNKRVAASFPMLSKRKKSEDKTQ